MPTIDADAHVIETEHTWDYLDEADRRYRPRILADPDAGPGQQREVWLIDGRVFPRRAFHVEKTGTTDATREMRDVQARLRHMDELGVDVQVLYTTLLLSPVTDKPEVELALTRSYNRWLADIWSLGGGRLRWAAVLPVRTMDQALPELRWAVGHGACAVHLRGAESGRVLGHPYFHPLYEEAARLNVPVCIHAGCGDVGLSQLYSAESAIFSRAKLPAVGAFHEIVFGELPARFPTLRFGFIETSAAWIPYVMHDLAARLGRKWGKTLDPDLLRANRLYVACQTDDDLPYILRYTSADQLVIGSDYGHADTSSELEALRHLKQEGKVAPEVIDKILDANARALYGL